MRVIMWHAVEEAEIFDEEVQEEENETDENDENDENLEPRSKRAKGDKGKTRATNGKTKSKKRRRKMLAKTEKKRIVNHVKSLNSMAAAVLSLTEAVSAMPNRDTNLISSCRRILPSQVAFFAKHLQEMFVELYNECSTIKDRYLHFQLKWHNHCSIFLVDRNQDLTMLGLHSSDPLASKVVSVRAQWSQVFTQHSIDKRGSKIFLMLLSSAIFNYFLRQCHGLLETKQKATVVTEDDKDTYLHFGGAALASMLHLRYEKMKGVKFDDKNVKQISEEITILQRINSYTKEHIPDYLKYRDNGHMYFPCPAILQFLTAVDLTTKENANEAGFKEHGSVLVLAAYT